MIDHDRPVVQADRHIWPFRETAARRHYAIAADQIVAQETDRAAAEGEIRNRGRGLPQRASQQRQGIGMVHLLDLAGHAAGRYTISADQCQIGIGRQDVVATAARFRKAAVQPDGPWKLPELGVIFTVVRPVRQPRDETLSQAPVQDPARAGDLRRDKITPIALQRGALQRGVGIRPPTHPLFDHRGQFEVLVADRILGVGAQLHQDATPADV